MFYKNNKFIDINKNHFLRNNKLRHSVNIIKLNLNKQNSQINNYSWNYNNSRYLLQTPKFEIPFSELLEQKKKNLYNIHIIMEINQHFIKGKIYWMIILKNVMKKSQFLILIIKKI